MTTAAESPFSKGRCERTVGLIKNGLRKLKEDGVKWKKEIILYWIVMARNTLQMVGGYSPYQLVFGRNPEIPILTGDVSPSMKEELPNASLREILEYAHKAKEIYVQQEADRKGRERITSERIR